MRNKVKKNRTREKTENKICNFKAEKNFKDAENSFIHLRDNELALEQINQVLTVEPAKIKALVLKGEILFSIDRETEALECFDMAINADPYSVVAYESKAGTLDVLGRQKEALYCCDKAFENITKKDEHLLPALFDQKIAILLRMKKYKEARLALQNCKNMLSKEDSHYLTACYKDVIENSYSEHIKKFEKVKKISLRLVN